MIGKVNSFTYNNRFHYGQSPQNNVNIALLRAYSGALAHDTLNFRAFRDSTPSIRDFGSKPEDRKGYMLYRNTTAVKYAKECEELWDMSLQGGIPNDPEYKKYVELLMKYKSPKGVQISDPQEREYFYKLADIIEQKILEKGFLHIPNTKKLNILKRDSQEMYDLAESLYSYNKYDILMFCSYYKVPGGKLLSYSTFGEDERLTYQCYDRLMPYIEKVRDKVQEMKTKKEFLEFKKTYGTNDIEKQKQTFASEFINAVNMNDSGKDVSVPNGILLYGNSEMKKEAMVSWIKEKTNFLIKECVYNPDNPKASIDNFTATLKDAQSVYSDTGVRTLIELNGFDELLTKQDSREARTALASFKNLAENASKEYYSTILLNTDKPIELFESPSIGAQRFPLQFELVRDSFSDMEARELEVITRELNRIENKRKTAFSDYSIVIDLPGDEHDQQPSSLKWTYDDVWANYGA